MEKGNVSSFSSAGKGIQNGQQQFRKGPVVAMTVIIIIIIIKW